MKIVTIWPGAVVAIGPEIELRVLANDDGIYKLAIAAPEALRIARRGGTRPPSLQRRRLQRRREHHRPQRPAAPDQVSTPPQPHES